MSKIKQRKVFLDIETGKEDNDGNNVSINVRITKVSDDRFNGNHPNKIYTGTVIEGKLIQGPKFGDRVVIATKGISSIFKTSEVIEITGGISTLLEEKDGVEFRTLNSTYRLEYI